MHASWWWIDRWRKSTAFTDMTAEQQGLYRNLLDEIWIRPDRIIPDNPRILARASGDEEAWGRNKEIVLKWMQRVDGGWTNVTASSIIHQSTRKARNQAAYRERQRGHSTDDVTGTLPASDRIVSAPPSPSPSPSPDPSPSPSPIANRSIKSNAAAVLSTTSGKNGKNGGGGEVNARSKHPVFKGQRFVVFDWQLEDLARLLGPNTDDFDLHEWFFTLDERCVQNRAVIPQRDGGKWLESQTREEAQRRGLSLGAALDARTSATVDALTRFVKKRETTQ